MSLAETSHVSSQLTFSHFGRLIFQLFVPACIVTFSHEVDGTIYKEKGALMRPKCQSGTKYRQCGQRTTHSKLGVKNAWPQCGQ